jgi:hypothetical protein
MLKGLVSHRDAHRRFHLYGHFKDEPLGERCLAVDEVQGLLVRRQRTDDGYETVNVQEEIGATDADLTTFSENLTIHLCEAFDTHRQGVIEQLRTVLDETAPEAEEFAYPSALTFITDLATNTNPVDRTTTKASFIVQLTPSRALHSAWLLRARGEVAFCRTMRSAHFSQRNIEAEPRFFVINTPTPDKAEILAVIRELRRKWSSHRSRRKPDQDRYAPYVYIPTLPEEELVAIKTTLHAQDIEFVDGYPFQGAAFDPEHIATPQTKHNRLSLRILSSEGDLNAALAHVAPCATVFEFYATMPLTWDEHHTHVQIPVTNIEMIKSIV